MVQTSLEMNKITKLLRLHALRIDFGPIQSKLDGNARVGTFLFIFAVKCLIWDFGGLQGGHFQTPFLAIFNFMSNGNEKVILTGDYNTN